MPGVQIRDPGTAHPCHYCKSNNCVEMKKQRKILEWTVQVQRILARCFFFFIYLKTQPRVIVGQRDALKF